MKLIRKEIKDFLSIKKHNTYRTPDDCLTNITLEKTLIKILRNYSKEIYLKNEPIWHELIRCAGPTTNVDATATREEVNEKKYPNDHSPYNYPHIEGQGSKVISKVYRIMNENPEKYFDPSFVQLTTFEKKDYWNK